MSITEFKIEAMPPAKQLSFSCSHESQEDKAVRMIGFWTPIKSDPGFPGVTMGDVEGKVAFIRAYEQWSKTSLEPWVLRGQEREVMDAGHTSGFFFSPVEADRYSCMKLIYELPDAALPETIETLTELRDHYRSLAEPIDPADLPAPPVKYTLPLR